MNRIIAVSGKIQSGKDYITNYIIKNSEYRFENKKFAGKLKEVASILLNIYRPRQYRLRYKYKTNILYRKRYINLSFFGEEIFPPK